MFGAKAPCLGIVLALPVRRHFLVGIAVDLLFSSEWSVVPFVGGEVRLSAVQDGLLLWVEWLPTQSGDGRGGLYVLQYTHCRVAMVLQYVYIQSNYFCCKDMIM